jgi:hypothetical protein
MFLRQLLPGMCQLLLAGLYYTTCGVQGESAQVYYALVDLRLAACLGVAMPGLVVLATSCVVYM